MHDKVISSVFASSKLYTNNLQSDLVYVHLWRRHEAFTVPDGRISFFCLVSVKQSQHEVHIITRTNTRINTLVFAKIILQHLNGHHARCHTSLLLFSLAFFGTLPYRREQSQRWVFSQGEKKRIRYKWSKRRLQSPLHFGPACISVGDLTDRLESAAPSNAAAECSCQVTTVSVTWPATARLPHSRVSNLPFTLQNQEC